MDSSFTYAEKMKIIFNKNIGSPLKGAWPKKLV